MVTVMVEVRRTYEAGGTPDAELETRFWNAYGLLRSAIEPTHRARRMYRWVFYVTLALLLLSQLAYLFGASVRDQITRLDEEHYRLLGQQQVAAAPPEEGADQGAGAALATPLSIQEQIEANEAARTDYRELARQLVPWFGTPSLALAALKIYLEFLSSYLLPALYGLLGACAFVLRQLSDDIGRLRFASDIKGQYTLRLNIGLLAGLAVGWFIQPDQEASVVANLPPLALAFVAGYGSDLLFAVLDRIVQAFTSPRGDGMTVREESAGGLERVERRSVETRVADGRRAEPEDERDATSGGTKPSRPAGEDPDAGEPRKAA
ncbi:MAG TPA: hypothetical protein VFZ01_06565 [Geminicoccaceae bacterium]